MIGFISSLMILVLSKSILSRHLNLLPSLFLNIILDPCIFIYTLPPPLHNIIGFHMKENMLFSFFLFELVWPRLILNLPTLFIFLQILWFYFYIELNSTPFYMGTRLSSFTCLLMDSLGIFISWCNEQGNSHCGVTDNSVVGCGILWMYV